MKRIIFLLSAVIFSTAIFAQIPQGMNYQGVARDPFGAAISKTAVNVQFHILQSGSPVYIETQSTTTDTFGLYTLTIGNGVPSLGTFNAIPWSAGNMSIRVDVNGSTVGTTPLMSVPYALYSGSSNGVVSVTSNTANITTSGTNTVTVDLANSGVTPNTYGSASGGAYPVITVDQYGRVTSASTQTFALGGVTSVNGVGGDPVSVTTFSTGAVTVSTQSVVASGTTTATGTSIPVITYDQYGRITGATSTPINGLIPASGLNGQVLGFAGGVPTWTTLAAPTTSITANAPLTGTGTSTISIPPADNVTDGYLKSADWSTFNNKVSTVTAGSGIIGPIGTGTNVTINADINSPLWNANSLQNVSVSSLTPTVGQVLTYTAGNWTPTTLSSGSTLPTPTVGSILYSDATNNWVASNPSGIYSDGTNIGMGTATPAAKIDIQTSSTALEINSTSTSGGNPVAHITGNDPTGYALKVDALSGAAITASSGAPYTITGNLSGFGSAGNAVVGQLLNSTGGGSAIWGNIDNTSTGNAGLFTNNNPGSTAVTLSVTTNSPGAYNAQFSGGKGVQVDKLQVTGGSGTAGQVLTSDISGNATWQSPASAGVTNIVTGTGLTGGPISSTGTISATNTTAMWNSNQLQNISVSSVTPAVNQSLIYNGAQWAPGNAGTVTNVTGAGPGLSGTVTTSGSISANNTAAIWNANQITSVSVSTVVPTTNQVLQYNGSQWAPTNAGAGTVTSITTNTTLTGGPITATGTLSLANFGTSGTYGTATNVPQITVDQYGRVSNINTLPITGLLPAGATDQILYYNGASWVGSTTSNFKFNGTGVGIGIATAPTVNLDVASSSTLTTINTVNSSSGAGIIGANSGTGNGGKFMTTNSANTNAALLVQTNSTSSGAALTAVSTGNGPAIISNGPLKLGGVVLDNTSSAGNIGDVLQSQGVGTIPKWQSPAGIVSAGGGWTTTGNTGTTASSAAIGSAANNNFIGTIDAKDFVIASGGFERMRITSGGNIGVGVVAPATNFHVVNSNPEIRVETPGGAFTAGYGIKTASQQWFIGQETGGSGVLRFKDVGAGVTRMQIASSTGYVGINTTSASDMLDVVSTTTAAAVNGSSSGSGTALVASNSGSGAALTATISNSVSAAATITSSNSANTQPALSITQAGSGKGLYLQNNGGGYGGYFYTPSPNTSNAIFAQQDGTGSALTVYQGSTSNSGAAGFFNVTQATNNANAIYANTSGTGAAVYATAVSGNAVYASNGGAGHTVFSVNGGTGGDAGYFQINNVGSNNDVIFANHTGSGHGVNVAVLGGAAVYARNNSATIATMDVMNGGGAPAGVFVTGSGNNADALKGNAGGTGNAVVGTNSSSGASSGGAGFFSNTNSGNTANALVANTAGTGFAAAFNGGQGLKTDGLTASMRTITANTTLAGGDCFIFVSAAGITVTLPQANVNPGRIYILMNPTTTYNLNTGSGSSAVIGPNGTIVVNASSSSLVGGGTVYRLVSDGTNWRTW